MNNIFKTGRVSLHFSLIAFLLMIPSTVEAQTSQADKEQITVEKVSKFIKEIAAESYPEINVKKIKVKNLKAIQTFSKQDFRSLVILHFKKCGILFMLIRRFLN